MQKFCIIMSKMPKDIEAIILVGGKGTRLQSTVSNLPKPMASVLNRPFLEWLLLSLYRQKVRRVCLSTGYMGEVIKQYFGTGQRFGMELRYGRDPHPLGTAGAVLHAMKHIQGDRFLVLNGDSYCRFDVTMLFNHHISTGAKATIWLIETEDSGRYGLVDVDAEGAVMGFHEKKPELQPGLINAGIYLFERSLTASIPKGRPVSLETEIFPTLAGCGLYAVVGNGPFLDIGTEKSYLAADSALETEFATLEQEANKGGKRP